MPEPEPLQVLVVRWPEIAAGADLAALVCEIDDLRDGDILVVTSKVIAKAEGRTVVADRTSVVADETRRVVARRGQLVIAETRHGFVMAAAGVDASNTAPGTAVPLPLDPDTSARRLREAVAAGRGLNVAIVISDTAGRAWRNGQTDLAVGCAGLPALIDLHGTLDTHGNQLLVTAPAIADEAAAAADLVKGKATGCPVAIVRGIGAHVLPTGDAGLGARELVRTPGDDLFGLGVREAVAAAVLRADPEALAHFPRRSPGDAEPFVGLAATADPRLRFELGVGACPVVPGEQTWTLEVSAPSDAAAEVVVSAGRLLERADTLAASQGLAHHDHELEVTSDRQRQLVHRCWWVG